MMFSHPANLEMAVTEEFLFVCFSVVGLIGGLAKPTLACFNNVSISLNIHQCRYLLLTEHESPIHIPAIYNENDATSAKPEQANSIKPNRQHHSHSTDLIKPQNYLVCI